jgi:hypothetical protein
MRSASRERASASREKGEEEDHNFFLKKIIHINVV